MTDHAPIVERHCLRFVNVPHTQELVRSIVDSDCYELAELNFQFVFIDLGACYGMASIRGHSWDATTYSYEPSEQSFEVLKANIAINGFENVIPIKEAVGYGMPVDHFYRPNNPTRSGPVNHSGSERQVVQSSTIGQILDRVRKAEGNPEIAIKMDIEGREGVVFDDLKWLKPVRFLALKTHNHDSDYFEFRLKEAGFKDIKLKGVGMDSGVSWNKTMQLGIVIARR